MDLFALDKMIINTLTSMSPMNFIYGSLILYMGVSVIENMRKTKEPRNKKVRK